MKYLDVLERLLIGKHKFLADIDCRYLGMSLEKFNMTPSEELFFIYFYTAKDLLCHEQPKHRFPNKFKTIEKSNVLIIPQIQIEQHRVDFLILYKDFRVIVELEGHEYHGKERTKNDKTRDRFLTKHGYIVFRLTRSEIFNDPALCVAEIFEYLLDGENSDHENKKSIREFIIGLLED